jgi:hypothetical protein
MAFAPPEWHLRAESANWDLCALYGSEDYRLSLYLTDYEFGGYDLTQYDEHGKAQPRNGIALPGIDEALEPFIEHLTKFAELAVAASLDLCSDSCQLCADNSLEDENDGE